MTDLPPPPPPLPYQPPEAFLPTAARRFRPTALIAWLVIVGVCVALPLLRAEKHVAAPTTLPATQPAEAEDRVTAQTEIAGRMWVGFVHLVDSLGDPKAGEQFKNAAWVPRETNTDRLATAVVLMELGERDAARKLLDQLAPTDEDAARLRAWYDRSAPPPGDRPLLTPSLRDRLGWYARLAEVYGKPDTDPARATVLADARRTAVTLLTALAFAVVMLGIGLVVCVLAIVLAASGKLRFAFVRPIGPAYVYVESMAIYLGGFIVVSLLIKWLLPEQSFVGSVVGLGGMVLLAAVWPLLRGATGTELRHDWGVHAGRGVLIEMAAGVGGYLAGLPVIAVALVVSLVLVQVTGAHPSHPIMQSVGESSIWVALMLYGIAAVFAPLTEELLFRGALVSHLRGGVGAVVAALISGLIFGAVHPQGWALVPGLMAVGAVLAIVRQWRGSLIASITAHALHNGVLVTIMLLATG